MFTWLIISALVGAAAIAVISITVIYLSIREINRLLKERKKVHEATKNTEFGGIIEELYAKSGKCTILVSSDGANVERLEVTFKNSSSDLHTGMRLKV
jgi:hypothetical protein